MAGGKHISTVALNGTNYPAWKVHGLVWGIVKHVLKEVLTRTSMPSS